MQPAGETCSEPPTSERTVGGCGHCRSSASNLVCLQRSWLTRFHQLKSIVCKACLEEGRHIVSQQLWRPHHTGGRQGTGWGREAGAGGRHSGDARLLPSSPFWLRQESAAQRAR